MAFGSGGQALERGQYGHMVKMYEISENLLLYINSKGGGAGCMVMRSMMKPAT